jgi:L-alanine-DL-glutamate epimerase-like enolase superfamily enzyme
LFEIVSARTYLSDLPVERPRTDAVQAFIKQETILVELQSADGTTGTGYAYTIGTGGSAVVQLLDAHLLGQVIGQDASRPEAIWKRLHDSTRATMVGAITALALAAVDTAVWDLRSRLLHVPLWRLAGGAQNRVPLYDTEGGWLHLSTEELVANATAAMSQGFKGVKIKVGKPSGAEDLARLGAVREAIGAEAALMVDANQGFTRDEALRRGRLFQPLDLTWIEEPLPADDVQGHVQLAAAIGIPVAVGESLYSVGQFREYVHNGAASVLQPDVARIGGITPWLKVAHLAEAFDLPVAPHFLMELHLSLSAAVPNGRWVEWIPQLSALISSPTKHVDGWLTPPETDGIGIDWNQEALRDYRVDLDGRQPVRGRTEA